MNYWQNIDKWNCIDKTTWDDWKWQLQNAITTYDGLKNILGQTNYLNNEQFTDIASTFEVKLTPHIVANMYNALKLGDKSSYDIYSNIFVPSIAELQHVYNGIDGIGEELSISKPAPLITNFYKNRVILFVTKLCPAYCRYCFRRRKVGKHRDQLTEDELMLEPIAQSIQYIKDNKEIKEVILSGGDPFLLADEKLLSIIFEIKQIKHIQMLRIDTKAFTTLPQRFTKSLIKELVRVKPLYIVGNFLHSAELTPEVLKATSKLIDNGIPVVSHTALLKGINDDADVISELMWKLYVNRILPYYLIQFIPTKWTEHFRVPIETGVNIVRKLHGKLSGIANPTYIVYLPDGAGKVPIFPNYLINHTSEGYTFENFEGKHILYKEPTLA